MSVTVKFIAKGSRTDDGPIWARQLPDGEHLGACRFVFDTEARQYDWLVVYDDLPPAQGERFAVRTENLSCVPQNTIFITSEPTSIKTYGQDFLRQFGIILSSLEPWATPSDRTILTQPGLRWFFGAPYSWKSKPDSLRTYRQMVESPGLYKTLNFSTVCSSKRMKHTLHNLRVDFTAEVKAAMPELEIFGRGVREIDDKAEALDAYRYHLAIENHICEHHFTDKLSDPLLGCCLPFYVGAPNAASYIPAESFIPVNIHNPREAIAVMKDAIASGQYEKRLPAILEARRLMLEKHNLFALIARTIEGGARCTPQNKGRIHSRRALLRSSPLIAARFGLERGLGWIRARTVA